MPIKKRILPAFVGLFVGGVLIVLGVPRLVAAYLALPGDMVVQTMVLGRPVSTEEVMRGAEAQAEANRWGMTGKRAAERGALLTGYADSLPEGGKRVTALAEAERVTETALALSPAQPLVWGRLAAIRMEEGDREKAAMALRLSLLTGPVVPDYVRDRLDLGLRLLPDLDGGTEALLARQARLLWLIDSSELVTLSKRPGAGAFVTRALNGLSEREADIFVERLSPAQ